MSLEIKNLHVAIDKKEIVKGLSITLKKGEVHAIMGPNGSGKSTLANSLLGHPKYTVTNGNIIVDKKDVTKLLPQKRAQAGLFLSMQYPPEIPGVTIANFLRLTTNVRTGKNQNPFTFQQKLHEKMDELKMDKGFALRYVNTGFSGGEKKRAEILQLLMLDPTYAILDETDSGLDVDALRVVAAGINKFHTKNNGVLLITHYNRILEYVVPDVIHIMVAGKIVKSGGKELAHEIEKDGYKKYL
jgi:Fe-S cluster assembly ATP-binding protein